MKLEWLGRKRGGKKKRNTKSHQGRRHRSKLDFSKLSSIPGHTYLSWQQCRKWFGVFFFPNCPVFSMVLRLSDKIQSCLGFFPRISGKYAIYNSVSDFIPPYQILFPCISSPFSLIPKQSVLIIAEIATMPNDWRVLYSVLRKEKKIFSLKKHLDIYYVPVRIARTAIMLNFNNVYHATYTCTL